MKRFSRSTERRLRADGEEDPLTLRTTRRDPGPLEDPVTDIEDPPEVPEPGPDHANPAPEENGSRSNGSEVPRRDRERRPIRPEWTRDPWGHIKWELGYVGYVAGFHGLRLLWYLLVCSGRSPRGIWRLGEDLKDYARHAESAPLRAAAVEEKNYAAYIKLSERTNHRGLIAAFIVLAVLGLAAAIALHPVWRWPGLLAAVVGLGVYGRPLDRPLIPSAVVAAPKYKKITPDMVLKALYGANLCKRNEEPAEAFEFVTPGVHRDGDGWSVRVHLPDGYTAPDAMKVRLKIAGSLRVDESRLFIERVRGDRGSAGLIDIYIADRDPFASEDGVPSPLIKARSFSVWKPVPFGYTARGKAVSFLLVWTGVLIGAMPRMGKSFAARLLAAAGALDITVRQIVFNGKHGKDWSAFKDVAHAYGAGARDHVVEYLVKTLRESVEDVNRRYERLESLSDEECPDGKVTPAICERRDLDMPLVQIIIDEVQEYLDHPEHGKIVEALLIKLAKLAPAVGYMLIISTQKPDGDTIKTALRDQLAARFCLKTANYDASKTVLGKLGEGDPRPEDLDPSQKGTGVLLGADVDGLAGFGTQVVRSHKMDLVDLRKVCKRGRELREVAGTLTGYAKGDLPEEPVPNLFLEHVHAAMDSTEEWVWSERICARLAETQPDLYDGWEPEDLGSALAKHGIGTKYRGGKNDAGKRVTWKAVIRRDVIDALAKRAGPAPDSPADEGL